jgi:hypothetical protein
MTPRLVLVVHVHHPPERRRAFWERGEDLPAVEVREISLTPRVPSWPLWTRVARFDQGEPSMGAPMHYRSSEEPGEAVPDDRELVALAAEFLAWKSSTARVISAVVREELASERRRRLRLALNDSNTGIFRLSTGTHDGAWGFATPREAWRCASALADMIEERYPGVSVELVDAPVRLGDFGTVSQKLADDIRAFAGAHLGEAVDRAWSYRRRA